MSNPPRGTKIRISVGRRLVNELLHHAKRVPSLPLSRECSIPEIAALRMKAMPSPSWMAIFIKAYAVAAQTHAELRRAWIPYPYSHLYQHPHSECAILIEREWEGEPIVLCAKLHCPEQSSLAAIDSHLREFREKPVWEVSSFRQLLRVGRMPSFLRRFVFWRILYLSGAKRAKRFGTFMASSLGAYGVEQHHPLTPLTTYLTFGPVSPSGNVTVKIIYDHRVMDGGHVARILRDVETILNTIILEELYLLPQGGG